MKKFSILICTRNRVALLLKALKSISKNTKNKKLIEVLIAIDEDDKNSILFIKKNKKKFNFLIKSIICKKGKGYRENPKRLKKLINISSGQFFIYFADDMTIDTKNWDINLDKKIKSLPKDQLYLLTTKHNQGNKNWPLCQIISQKWYKITKKFANCYETDTELMIISSNIMRYYICENIKIVHNQISRKDETFKKGRQLLLDKKIYEGSVLTFKGIKNILNDLYKIQLKINKYNYFQKFFYLWKMYTFIIIKIIFKYKLNFLRNFY